MLEMQERAQTLPEQKITQKSIDADSECNALERPIF
jgi:hypothetical protein